CHSGAGGWNVGRFSLSSLLPVALASRFEPRPLDRWIHRRIHHAAATTLRRNPAFTMGVAHLMATRKQYLCESPVVAHLHLQIPPRANRLAATRIGWKESGFSPTVAPIHQRSASLNDPSTPTPARYYSQRLPPIAEPSQMDVLMNMVQRLLDDNTEIKQRLGVLERAASRRRHLLLQSAASQPSGGRITQAKTRAQRRRVTVVGGGGSENNIAIDPALDASSASDFATDTDYPSDNDNPSDAASDYRSDASTDHPSDACDSAGPIALNSLDLSDVNQQSLVCNSFVTKGFDVFAMFPGPTGRTLSLYGPTSSRTRFIRLRFLSSASRNTRNASLCIQDRDAWPSGLKREPTEPEPWDLPLLNELAKESFRKSWRTQTNPNAAAKAKIGRQSERQNKRRKAKAKNIRKIVDTFGAARRLQPDFLRDISHEQISPKKSRAPMRILVRATKRGRSGARSQRMCQRMQHP
ncbi:hypothetical protein B0H14DRAFT_3733577, partial [Mycena olivaceomarginata]